MNAFRAGGKRTGQGRHVEFLAQQWSRTQVPFDRIVLMSPRPVTIDGLGDVTPIEFRHFGSRLPAAVWEQAALPYEARSASILFCPTYTAPVGHRGRFVVMNHGIYERLPNEFSRAQRLRTTPLHRMSARRADRVIANSHATKRDIVDFFDVDGDKIDVVHPAAAEVFFRRHPPEAIAEESRRVLGREAPYFLFVGKLSRRRHVPNLIEAFAAVRSQLGLPHMLLVVGPNSANVDVGGISAAHGVGDDVVYVDHLEQGPLAHLYAGAEAFVLPTTYEGISQTMFEAMASGAPVLTVEHPTLAEGAGDAALAVENPSVEALVDGFRRILEDPELRRSLSDRGRERARLFSWNANATATAEILDRVARPRDGGR